MSNSDIDYDDPKFVAGWIKEQKAHVLEYLRGEKVFHGGVCEEPAYCAPPYVAVWYVLQAENKDKIAFWVISGDLPTDYVSSNDANNAREVLAHFAASWTEVATCMTTGRKHPAISIGPPEKWAELAPLLQARADLLRQFANDEAYWKEKDLNIDSGPDV